MLTVVKDCQGEAFTVVGNLDYQQVQGLCDRMTDAVCAWWDQEPAPPNSDGQAFFVADRLNILLPRQGGGIGHSDDLESVFKIAVRQLGGTIADFGVCQTEI